MVAVLKVAVFVRGPFVGSHSLKIANGIADIKVVRLLRCSHTRRLSVFIDIFKITEQEHALTAASTEITIQFHAFVAGILAEILYRHTKLIGVQVTVEVIRW